MALWTPTSPICWPTTRSPTSRSPQGRFNLSELDTPFRDITSDLVRERGDIVSAIPKVEASRMGMPEPSTEQSRTVRAQVIEDVHEPNRPICPCFHSFMQALPAPATPRSCDAVPR